MMDHEPARRAAGAASETVALKYQLAQAAKRAQRTIAAIIAQPAAAAGLQLNWPAATFAEQAQLSALLLPRRLQR